MSVVIPVRDDADHLRRCLAALAAQTRPADELVVVDNGSRDDGAAVARAAGAVVPSEPVPGISRAASLGYDTATGDVLVRLDADSVPPPHWIAAALDLLADPAVVAVTGPGRPLGHALVVRVLWDVLYMRPYFALMHSALTRPPLYGSAMAMRRSTWVAVRSRVHRLDADVHDDIDLSMQLDPAWQVRLDASLTVGVSARPFSSLSSAVLRTRRALHTFHVNGRRASPIRRWARRVRTALRTASRTSGAQAPRRHR